MSIIVNSAAVDWLTVSTHSEDAAEFWFKLYDKDAAKQFQVMQYVGAFWQKPEGSLFVGSAEQTTNLHHLIRVSGSLADDLKSNAYNQIKQGTVKLTRIDLQLTIAEPEGWSQWTLFNRCKRNGRKVGWHESEDREAGTLETVYIGSRLSNRFSRVYIKVTNGGGRLLRLETEYKSERAHHVGRMLAEGKATAGAFLLHELQKSIGDEELELAFAPTIAANQPATARLSKETDDDKTFNWLMHQVSPVFFRILNQHPRAEELAERYIELIYNAEIYNE